MVSILLVDDEIDWADTLGRTLIKYNITSHEQLFKTKNSKETLNILKQKKIDLVILDLYLENENGDSVLEEILRNNPEQNVVMLTGSSSVEHAVNCMKLGAKDYFIKSLPVMELVENIRRVIKIVKLEEENINIRNQILSNENYPEFNDYITVSKSMNLLFGYIKTISKSSEHLLITGESGVGKGIIAKAAAKLFRPGKPFVSINIAGYDNQMFSDTLFGHLKGAFTGAESARQGMVKQAENGVVFLDEIGDLPLQSQVKLLTLIQDGEYQQLGSDKIAKTNAKFIFATNRDLTEMLKLKTFRHDLYFRLNTHRVHIPSLRERPEDIEPLIHFFAASAITDFDKNNLQFSDNFIESLMQYDFPGNVRELRSIIYDAVARSEGVVDNLKLPKNIKKYESLKNLITSDNNDYIPSIEEATNILIKKAIKKTKGNQINAAKILGISQPTLSRKLKELGE